MTKREIIKTKKICVACGEDFLGTAGKMTCSSRCRSIIARLKAANRKPEFLFMVKSKGQKIPDLSAPKRLRLKKGEKMKKPEILKTKIDYKEPTPESYDGKKLENIVFDETPLFVTEPPLDKFKKLALINELQQEIKKIEGRKHGFGDGHPKMFAMAKQDEIEKIQEQIKKLQ